MHVEMGWSDISADSDTPSVLEEKPQVPTTTAATHEEHHRVRSRSPHTATRALIVEQREAVADSSSSGIATMTMGWPYGQALSTTHIPAEGTGWWATPLLTSVEHIRRKLPHKSRPLMIESICAGTFAEGFVCEAGRKFRSSEGTLVRALTEQSQ